MSVKAPPPSSKKDDYPAPPPAAKVEASAPAEDDQSDDEKEVSSSSSLLPLPASSRDAEVDGGGTALAGRRSLPRCLSWSSPSSCSTSREHLVKTSRLVARARQRWARCPMHGPGLVEPPRSFLARLALRSDWPVSSLGPYLIARSLSLSLLPPRSSRHRLRPSPTLLSRHPRVIARPSFLAFPPSPSSSSRGPLLTFNPSPRSRPVLRRAGPSMAAPSSPLSPRPLCPLASPPSPPASAVRTPLRSDDSPGIHE